MPRNNPELRRGYLPILPTSYREISEILKGWKSDPHILTYIYEKGYPSEFGGYLRFKFDFDPETGNELFAEVTYGLLNGKRSAGLTSEALELAISFFKKE